MRFLLAVQAGLRATDLAALPWAMVTDATGQGGEVLPLAQRARQGEERGRVIPLHRERRAALLTL